MGRRMRETEPDISISSEIGFEEDLMRRLVEGTLDIGMMYTPQHSPGIQIEHLFDEVLVLLTTDPAKPWPGQGLHLRELGPGFYAQHRMSYPDLERPAQVVNIGWLGVQLIINNGGSCFLPLRMAEPLIAEGKLFQVSDSPMFRLPVYVVFQREADTLVVGQALAGLRELAEVEQAKADNWLKVESAAAVGTPSGHGKLFILDPVLTGLRLKITA